MGQNLVVAFWLIGVVMHIAGSFIHLLLVVALLVLLYTLFIGRRHTQGAAKRDGGWSPPSRLRMRHDGQ